MQRGQKHLCSFLLSSAVHLQKTHRSHRSFYSMRKTEWSMKKNRTIQLSMNTVSLGELTSQHSKAVQVYDSCVSLMNHLLKTTKRDFQTPVSPHHCSGVLWNWAQQPGGRQVKGDQEKERTMKTVEHDCQYFGRLLGSQHFQSLAKVQERLQGLPFPFFHHSTHCGILYNKEGQLFTSTLYKCRHWTICLLHIQTLRPLMVYQCYFVKCAILCAISKIERL